MAASPGLVASQLTSLNVDQLQFSQADVSPCFSDGTPLVEAVSSLVKGEVQVSDIPHMRILAVPSGLISLDNRRLWVFKRLAHLTRQSISVPVLLTSSPSAIDLADLYRKLANSGISAPVPDAAIRQASWCPSQRESFVAVVLRWNCAELLQNVHMYANKVKKLPLSYTAGPAGVQEFCAAKLPHLTEEVRAQLHQQLEQSCDLQWAQVQLDTRHAAVQQSMNDNSGLITLMVTDLEAHRSASGWGQSSSTNADSWSNWRQSTSKGPLGCKPTDLVVISSMPVCDTTTWQREDVVHSLGLVMQLERSDEDSLTAAAEVQVFAHPASAMWERLGLGTHTGFMDTSSKELPRWHMAVISSAASSQRTWAGITEQYMAAANAQGVASTATASTKTTLSGILRNVVHPSARMLEPAELHANAAVQEYCSQQQLNASQQRAVECIAAASEAAGPWNRVHESSCVQLIQGPPGTGKTSTITRALSVLLGMGRSVLVCAPTNVAVQEVALRFMQLLQQDAGANMYGAADSMTLGDVALLAAEDQVPKGGGIEAIWSQGRAQRLQSALGSVAGLRAATARLARLISSPAAVFKDYLQQQTPASQQDDDSSVPLRPEAWFQNEVASLCQLISSMVMAVAQDLPSHCTSRQRVAELQDIALRFLPAAASTVKAASLQTVLRAYEQLAAAVDSTTVHAIEAQAPNDASHLVCTLKQAVKNSQQICTRLPDIPGANKPDQNKALSAIHRFILRHAKVVFCTVASSGRPVLAKARCEEQKQESARKFQQLGDDEDLPPGFDVCIIDEAGQLVEAETCITLNAFPQLPVLVLVGDHKQLPATVISHLASEQGYKRSMFERLQQCGVPLHMLDTQYRMHPHISRYPSNTFYDGKLLGDSSMHASERGQHVSSLPIFQQLGPYHVIHVLHGHEEQCKKTASKLNRFEATAVRSVVTTLVKEHQAAAGGQHLSIGIISPYAAQVAYLQEQLQGYLKPSSTTKRAVGVQLEIKSVDGFQGREMDVIIITTVRSNRHGQVGFLEDLRRLNVAITRGRHAVWLFVNKDTLTADQGWAHLLKDAAERGLLLSNEKAPVLRAASKHMRDLLVEEPQLLTPDCDLFKSTLWQVVFSHEFISDIKPLEKQQRVMVIQRLVQLAEGRRPVGYPAGLLQYNQTSAQFQQLIHVQHMVEKKLVWMVDIDKSLCRQVLKVYRLVPDDLVLPTVRRVEAALAVYTSEYLSRCSKVHRGATPSMVLPYTWPKDTSFEWLRNNQKGHAGAHSVAAREDSVLEHAAVEQSLLLMKFFPLDAASAYLLTASAANAQIDLMFSLNEQEMLILDYPGTKFVQGRSGTGKTTVIVALLLLMEQACIEVGLGEHPSPTAPSANSGGSGAVDSGLPRSDMDTDSAASGCGPAVKGRQGTRVRQLLLTLSPKLCAAMRADIARKAATMRCAQGSERTNGQANGEASTDPYLGQQLLDEEAVAKLTRGLPKALSKVLDDQCPLVLPLEQLLWMLDASMPVSFAHSRQLGHGRTHGAWHGGEGEDGDEEGDVVGDGRGNEDNMDWAAVSTVLSHPQDVTKAQVTFDVFNETYYPSLDADKRKGLSAAALWTEIQTHIKGSRDAAYNRNGRLTQQQYTGLADMRVGQQLSAVQRQAVYDLFLQYERMKGARYAWDVCDLTHHLHLQLQQHGYLANAQFHYVYVDEVQDLLPSQILLLSYLCSQPDKGFVFAGDTAQTIARGVGFRFQDIRSLFYLDFLKHGEAHSSASGSKQAATQPTMPDMFQLVRNYRTHSGIIELAHTLVQAITHFFPLSIDKLQPERSLLAGRCPVFVDDADPLQVLLGRGLGQEGMTVGAAGCDFGAEQVVLVRDEAYKQQLLQKLGPQAAANMLVLTAHECKGLEFQVVLVHGFFSSSPLDQAWRLMYGLMAELGLLSGKEQASGKFQAPVFDQKKHQLLCSELKLLYVVVTRAKHCVLMYEPQPGKAEPMLELWCRQGVMERCEMGPELKELLVRDSTAEEWMRRAQDLFNSGHYNHARMCAHKAGDDHLAARCEAQDLRQRAGRCAVTEQRRQLYADAATIFLRCGLQEQAANCYVESEQNQEAALLFEQLQKPAKAAALYMKAQPAQLEKAAGCWASAGRLAHALDICVQGFSGQKGSARSPYHVEASFADLGLQLITSTHQPAATVQQLRADFIERVVWHLADLLTAARSVKAGTAMKKAQDTLRGLLVTYLGLLGDQDVQRDMLDRFDLKEGLLELEVCAGNFAAAARLCEELGRQQDALEYHIKAGNHVRALAAYTQLLRLACQWGHPVPGKKVLAGQLTATSPEVCKLRERVKELLQSDWAQPHLPATVPTCFATQSQNVQPAQGDQWQQQQQQQSGGKAGHAEVEAAVLEAYVLVTLLDKHAVLSGSREASSGQAADHDVLLAEMQSLMQLQLHVQKYMPSSCSSLLLCLQLWHASASIVQQSAAELSAAKAVPASAPSSAAAPASLQQQWGRQQPKQQPAAAATFAAVAATSGNGNNKKKAKLHQRQQQQQQQQQAKRDTVAAVSRTPPQIKAVVTSALELLLQQWQLLLHQLKELLKVLSLASNKKLVTSGDKHQWCVLMQWLGCAPVPERPGYVRPQQHVPSWLPPHKHPQSEELVMLTEPELAGMATRLLVVELQGAAKTIISLTTSPDGPMHHLPMSYQDLKQAQTVQQTSAASPAVCPVVVALSHTSTVALCCHLLLAFREACLELQALTPSSAELPQLAHVPQKLYELCVVPQCVVLQQPTAAWPGAQLVQQPAVTARLQAWALELAARKPHLPARLLHLSRPVQGMQPLLSADISYERLAQLVLLQGCLSVDIMPEKIPTWACQSWAFGRTINLRDLTSWQQLVVYLRTTRALRFQLAAAAAMPRSSQQQQDEGRKAVVEAFNTSQYATSAGLEACSSIHTLMDETGMARPGMSAFTYIALAERLCTLALAQFTNCRNCVLPRSLVMVHLSLPGPTAQLTSLMKSGYSSSKGFKQSLACDFASIAAQLADFLSSTKWLVDQFSGKLSEDELSMWALRALTLLFTLAVNVHVGGYRRVPPAASLLQHLRQRDGGPNLPAKVTLELTRLEAYAARQGGLDGQNPALWRAFDAILRSVGDEPVLLHTDPAARPNSMLPKAAILCVRQLTAGITEPQGLPVEASYEFSLQQRHQQAATATAAAAAATPATAPAQQNAADEDAADDLQGGEEASAAAEAAEQAALAVLKAMLRNPRVACGLCAGLKRVRVARAGELNAVQALQREAYRVFLQQGTTPGQAWRQLATLAKPGQARKGQQVRTTRLLRGCIYTQEYLHDLCPLQVDISHMATRLPEAKQQLMQAVRDGGRLPAEGTTSNEEGEEEGVDEQQKCQAALQACKQQLQDLTKLQRHWQQLQPYLDPNHPKHQQADVRWLRAELLQPLMDVKARLTQHAGVLQL